MFQSDSSTKRFFNKLRRPFQRSTDYYYFDQQEFGPLIPGEINSAEFLPLNSDNKITNRRLSIIPFLQNAGLDINKLNYEVIEALNKINIDDDISMPNQQIPNYQQLKIEKSKRPHREDERYPVSESFYPESGPVLENKSNQPISQPTFSSPAPVLKEGAQSKFKDIEIYGDFSHFSSDLSWNERKRQLKFKDLAKNDIVSESILKNIDELIKTNNKQYKQLSNLVSNFEKYLSSKNKVYLKPESEEILENFIKIFNVRGYSKMTENEMLSYLQNFIFGIYIREGTLKKCHSNVLSAKINGEFASKNNDVDVNFYYEEFQKIQNNFVEDSKNYSDYISEEGSLFLMNMVANIQKYSFKEETCHQEIYCDRFDHLYKQYPQEMLEKLFEYNIRYQVCNWNFFEKFLHQEDKKKKSEISDNPKNNEITATKQKADRSEVIRSQKSNKRERKIKQPHIRQYLSLDNDDEQKKQFENRDMNNISVNNPNSSHLKLESNKQQEIDDKDSSKLDNRIMGPFFKAENLESGTAVEQSNKENITSYTMEEKLASHSQLYSSKATSSKAGLPKMGNFPGLYE